LIFLLLNSAVVFTPGIPVRLPEGGDLPALSKPSLTVVVDQAGSFYFNNQLCDEARLEQRLRAAVEQSREPVACC
jgi:biopolymer transport protein ExbD